MVARASPSPPRPDLPGRSSGHLNYTTNPPSATFLKFKLIIVVFLLLAGLVPGLLGLAGTYRASEKELIESKGLYFKEVASFTAFQVEQTLQDEVDTIRRLAQLPSVRNLIAFHDESDLEQVEIIRQIIIPELAKRYFIARIFNAAGEIVFDSKITHNGEPVDIRIDKTRIRSLKKGEIYVSDVLETTSPEVVYFLEIYLPVNDDDGKFIGFIQARYAVDELFETIKNVSIGKTGHANLITSTADILVCPIYPPKSHKVGADLIGKISEKDEPGWSVTDDDGHGSKGTIVGFSPVNLRIASLSLDSFGNKKWYIFTRQEPYETFESVGKFQNSVIFYAVLLILLTLGIVAFALRQILKAQKSHQREVVYREKAESVKQLLANFQQFMFTPLDEFRKCLSDIGDNGKSAGFNSARLKKIIKSMLGMDSLIEHLTYYTQTGKYDLERVDLDKVVGESLALLDYMISDKGIKVEMNKPDEPIMLMSQDKLLSIVVMNIMLNAVHAIGEPGQIRVKLTKSNGWGVCEIEDNGGGIPQDKMESIFDPFYTTKKGRNGHGLGLAVSRGIVDDQGGRISIKSAVGEGTMVQIKLRLW